ncbi:MAG TPA: PilZ domain-containing protein [Candidatus Xenobia bacterium]|jgi:hypothetical protein
MPQDSQEGATGAATAPPDKRQTYRVSCSLPVTARLDETERLGGRLLNLSTTGLKLCFPRALKPGTEYNIVLHGRPTAEGGAGRELSIDGRCIWCRRSWHGEGYDVGCLFTGFAGVRMNEVLDFLRDELHIESEPAPEGLRLSRRCNMVFIAGDGQQYQGFIRHLTPGRLHMASRTPIANGTELTLSHGDQTLSGTVQVAKCRKMHREDWFEVEARWLGCTLEEERRLTQQLATWS